MNFPEPLQIKEYCEEALEITDRYGVYEGLSFLIGQKFYAILRQLRDAQNQVKYLYPNSSQKTRQSPSPFADKTMRLNYSLTIRENYGALLENVKLLEKMRDNFVAEIKEAFEITDIADYLSSYPRLGLAWDAPLYEGDIPQKASPFSAQEVLAEIQDVFFVEKMKKLFLNS